MPLMEYEYTDWENKMIQTPFSAYKGEENYIFISYAHKDMGNVFPAIKALHERGYRIWYDEGIEAGEDWSESIASHLEKAAVVLYFMSRNTARRENIERELACSEKNSIPVLTVTMGKFRLTPQQEKQTTVRQFIRLDSYKTYDGFAAGISPVLDRYDVCEQREEKDERQLAFTKQDRIQIQDERKKKTITIASVVAAILLITFLIFILLFRKVPSVLGMKTEDAEQAVLQAGFTPTVSLNYSDTYEYGTIFEQSAEGRTLKMIPVVITQSLGPEENLTDVPDVVGTEISDGAKMLIDAGLKKFTVSAEFESSMAMGYISSQSIPAGLRVSKSNKMALDVRTDGGEYTFTIGTQTYTLTGDEAIEIDAEDLNEAAEEIGQKDETEEHIINDDIPLSLARPEQFRMTDAEWTLFRQNNKHSIWEPQKYQNVWFPAALATTIANHPDECYGWVVVRDMEIAAESLFSGYSEIYVCPGITVTVKGRVTDTDSLNDYYVAPGGRLVFEDEVSGGVYLANDGTTRFSRTVNGGRDGILIGNRGNIEVNGTIGKGVTLWNFFGASVTGEDATGGTLHDYSEHRQVTATNWYEGCSGEKGLGILAGKMETFAGYDSFEEGTRMEFGITPVINPEDYEDHYQEEWYTSIYLFLNDYTVTRFRNGRGCYWELIAAPGVTLTIDTPNKDQGTGVVAEKDSTVIINSDIQSYYPYGAYFINDGTTVLNGNYVTVPGGHYSLLMNRGTFIANGSFGGSETSVFNFAGSSFTGNIVDTTYVQNIDWRPEYVTYDNGTGGALRYQEDVLCKQYGYRDWQTY